MMRIGLSKMLRAAMRAALCVALCWPIPCAAQKDSGVRVGGSLQGLVAGPSGVGVGVGGRLELSEGHGGLVWSVGRDYMWARDGSVHAPEWEDAVFTHLGAAVALSPRASRTRLFVGVEFGRMKHDHGTESNYIGLDIGSRTEVADPIDLLINVRGRRGPDVRMVQLSLGVAYPTIRKRVQQGGGKK